jgi:hypothetical protein
LHYQVPRGYVADTDVAAFISGEIDQKKFLESTIKESSVERLLELLHHSIDTIPEENIAKVLESIYAVFLPSDYLRKHSNKLFEFDLLRNIRWLTYSLIRKSTDIPQLINPIIRNKDYIYITNEILRMLMVQHGEVETDDPSRKAEKWLDKKQYEAAKKHWVSAAIHEIKAGTLLEPDMANNVFITLSLADINRTRTLLNELLSQEGGLAKIAQLIGWSGISEKKGPFSQIDRKHFEDLLDFEKLGALAEKELKSGKQLSSYQQSVYKSIVSGDKYYHLDASKGSKF